MLRARIECTKKDIEEPDADLVLAELGVGRIVA
jgi:hypothetical protein